MLELALTALVLILLSSGMVYYIVDTLRLVDSYVDSGPFEDKDKEVVWVRVHEFNEFEGSRTVTRDTRPVNLWDIVRGFFGVYDKVLNEPYEDEVDPTISEYWYVNPERAKVWSCPHCLGFWVSVLPGIFISLSLPGIAFHWRVILAPIVVLSLSGFHSMFVSVIDAMYNKGEIEILHMGEDDYD